MPNVNFCAAELVYGPILRLPEEFLEQSAAPAPGHVNDLLHGLHPQPAASISPPLPNATHLLDLTKGPTESVDWLTLAGQIVLMTHSALKL